jgi:hypothetical protein
VTGDQMHISEAELRAMTAEMVEMHEATFPEMRANLSDLGSALREDERGHNAARRRFLIGGGALAAGSLLLATTGGRAAAAELTSDGSAAPADTFTASAKNDMAALKLDASLENLAVFAYGAAR